MGLQVAMLLLLHLLYALARFASFLMSLLPRRAAPLATNGKRPAHVAIVFAPGDTLARMREEVRRALVWSEQDHIRELTLYDPLGTLLP